MNIRQKINFRNQLLIVLAKTFGLIMLGILGMYYFSKNIERSVAESVQKRTMIFSQARQIENLNRLKSDYEKIKNDIPRLKTALPSREELIILPGRFENEARALGIRQNFSFGQEVAAQAAEPQGILFSLEISAAAGEQFLSFLRRINDLPYFLSIDQIGGIGERGLENSSQFSIKGKIYTR